MNSFLTFAQEFKSDQIKSNQKFTLPYVKISLWLWCSPYFRKYLCYKIICNLDMKILVAKEIFSWSICTIGWYHIWRIIIIYEILMICTCINTGSWGIWWNLYGKFRWLFRQIRPISVYENYLTLLCTTPSWLIFIIFAILPPWLYILCLIKLAHMVSNTEIKGGWGAFWPGQGKLYNEVSP